MGKRLVAAVTKIRATSAEGSVQEMGLVMREASVLSIFVGFFCKLNMKDNK